MFSNEVLVFVGFLFLVALMLAIDIGVFNKKIHEVGFKEALSYTILWVSVGIIILGTDLFLWSSYS